jgi:hypothetical protein
MRSFISIAIAFLGCSAFAGTGPFLLGAIVGDPTGVSGRYDLQKETSIDGALSYSLGGRSGAQIHGDYLKTKSKAVQAGDTSLDFYYGIGARLITLSSGDDKGRVSFGPRVPVGLKHEIKDPSVEFFGEVAFILDITPSTAADLDLAVGARYRF